MKKLSLLLGVLAILSFSNLTFSQLLFSEDFTGYTAGVLTGQGGWTHAGSGLDAPVVANTTPLTYAGYNFGGGNYMNFATNSGTTGRVYKDFVDTTTSMINPGTVVYVSFLLNLTTTYTTATGYFFTLGQSNAVANYFAKCFAKNLTATTYNLGISNNSNTGVFAPVVMNTGQTYLIVIRYNINNNYPSLKLNSLEAWINPSLTSEPDTSIADAKYVGDSTYTTYSLGAIMWHNRGVNNPIGSIDGIRVAKSTNSSAEAWSFLGAGGVTPVELTSFSASVVKGAVNLS
jgi:hypothetical protein